MTSASISITMAEWQNVTPRTNASLRGLYLLNDAARDAAARLERSGALQIVEKREGLEVRAFSYVGKVQLGDLAVTVCPKIPDSTLLRLMRYAYDLRNLSLFDKVTLDTQVNGFQDLLLFQLAEEAEELTARGLLRKYLRHEESLASPRGAINLRELTRAGSLKRATLPCIHYTRSQDYLPNQVLLSGLQWGAKLAQSPLLRIRLRRLASLLREDVTPVTLDKQTFARLNAQSNRLAASYQPAFTLIHLLLSGAGISLDADDNSLPLSGFLFDMNRFFQALLSRFLHENLAEYKVEDESRLSGTVVYNPMYNPLRRTSPSPRPDYMVMKNGKVMAVLDAKYRDLWQTSLPREMLYQLAMYALVGGCEHGATILYPALSPEASEQRLDVHSPINGLHKTQITLRPVHLNTLEQLLFQPPGAQGRRDRAIFARQLAFGYVLQ